MLYIGLPSGATSVGTVGISPSNGYPVSITLYKASSCLDFKYVILISMLLGRSLV